MTGFKYRSVLLSLFTLSLCLGSNVNSFGMESPKSTTVGINTSYGANLDKENRQSSFTLVPEINYRPDPKTRLNFSTVVDRPTLPSSEIKIPTITLAGIKELDPTGAINPNVSLAFSALSLDKLNSEGLSIRTRPALGISMQLFSFLSLTGRMGPYLILSQNRKFSYGEPKPKFGINELIKAEITVYSFKLGVDLIVDQAYTTFWRNNYSSSQSIEYLFSKSVSAGFSHSLLSSVIDDSTGFYRTVQGGNDRLSRLSLFLNASF